MRRVPMHMRDWITKLHGFLTINERDILTHAGKISHEMAKELAEAEYENSTASASSKLTRRAAILTRPSNNCRRLRQRKREGRNEPRNPQRQNHRRLLPPFVGEGGKGRGFCLCGWGERRGGERDGTNKKQKKKELRKLKRKMEKEK